MRGSCSLRPTFVPPEGFETHPEQLLGEIPPVVDAPVHGRESLDRRLVPDVGVVQAGVQHDHGEGQNVAGVCGAAGTTEEERTRYNEQKRKLRKTPKFPKVWEDLTGNKPAKHS